MPRGQVRRAALPGAPTVSWTVLPGSTKRERLIIEDDLVACAITSDGRVPVAPFLDRGRREGSESRRSAVGGHQKLPNGGQQEPPPNGHVS